MSGRIPATRATALRAAQEAKAHRDAERLRREAQVESALTDFYEETARAEHIRASAKLRANKLLADAEKASAAPEERARSAVIALRDLGETRHQIAELTGLALPEVRALLPRHSEAPDATLPSTPEP